MGRSADRRRWLARIGRVPLHRPRAALPFRLRRLALRGPGPHLAVSRPHSLSARSQGDPKAETRDGFTEPALEVLADGALYSVLRTTDGSGIGPMYHIRSSDLGRTWSQPTVMAPNGVLPRLLRLENGIVVLASGRPGVQLRFSEKGNGEDWSEPWDLLPFDPADPHADSCGYTDLLPLDADSFLIVYSWFQKPDAEGRRRKAILARCIRVTADTRSSWPLPPSRFEDSR